MKPHLRIAWGIIGYPILLGRLLKVVCVDIDPERRHGGAHRARGGRLCPRRGGGTRQHLSTVSEVIFTVLGFSRPVCDDLSMLSVSSPWPTHRPWGISMKSWKPAYSGCTVSSGMNWRPQSLSCSDMPRAPDSPASQVWRLSWNKETPHCRVSLTWSHSPCWAPPWLENLMWVSKSLKAIW